MLAAASAMTSVPLAVLALAAWRRTRRPSWRQHVDTAIRLTRPRP